MAFRLKSISHAALHPNPRCNGKLAGEFRVIKDNGRIKRAVETATIVMWLKLLLG